MRLRHFATASPLLTALLGLGVGIIVSFYGWGDRSLSIPPAALADSPPASPDRIVLTFGVGGVLTDDGTLWQYRPDLDTWLTMDDAYRMEGHENIRTMPLPVNVSEIRDMASWGFIVTTSGDLWLYDIDADRWKMLANPPKVP